MCGICGVLSFDGPPIASQTLRRMTDTLAHRGPDDEGVFVSARKGGLQVGLGHRRLAIIDLTDAAAQPMANEEQTIWVVFNGEIYNFRELRAQLIARGHRFRSQSDTEVILRLYQEQGIRCVERLDGMFAFAVWDQPQRRLILARDRMGKKPLFFASRHGVFAFASEIKALLGHPGIAPEVNTEALPAFFLYGYVPTPRTIYRGIEKLPPGHVLEIAANGKVRLEPYWDLPLTAGETRVPPSDAQAVSRVRGLVTEAVRRRLIADVPLGAFLSGGIDSSIVVGLMSQLMREPVRTFSIGFSGDGRFDETSYARLAARHFGTRHTEFTVEPSAVDLIERLVWLHDGPFADSSAIPTYLLSRLSREHVTVALNGDGGDELFAGYPRFYATLISERVPPQLRQMAFRLCARLPAWRVFHRLQKLSRSATLPFDQRFTRWISVFYEDLPRLMGSPPNEHDGRLALTIQEPDLRQGEHVTPLSRLLYRNLKTYLLDDLLVKMDRCSMAHGLEARSPFLDRDLVEYVFALPDAMKLRWGRTKHILRRTFGDLVPPAIVRRGKMGFGVPLQAWFATDLRDYLADYLVGPDARLRGYVDQGYVRELFHAHRTRRADHSYRLWTLLTFEIWLRTMSSWSAPREEAEAVGVKAS